MFIFNFSGFYPKTSSNLFSWNNSIAAIMKAVVYFDQHLVAGHSIPWLKYAISKFFVLKAEKPKKKQQIMRKFNMKVVF